MKKLLLAASLLSSAAFGQVTLGNEHFPATNDELIMSTLLDMNIDYLSTGANYTWDFSTLVPTSQRVTNCKPVSEASAFSNFLFGGFAPVPYKASYYSTLTDFPLGELTSGLPVNLEDVSQFTKSVPEAMTLVGFEFMISGQGLAVRSDTIETKYEFPLNYGDSYTSHGYTNLDMNPLYEAILRQHRFRETDVDGWGTITTPYGTFNALRIHHRIQESDSIFFDFTGSGTGMWIGLPIPEMHEYEWRAAEEHEAILRVKTAVVAGTETITGVEYRDNYNGLGLEETAINVALYPNPFSSQLTVKASAVIESAVLLNQQGQTVQAFPGLHGLSTVLDVSHLEAGMYYLTVRTTAGEQTQLVIRE